MRLAYPVPRLDDPRVGPSDHAQARRIARRAKSFVLINDELYKRSPSGILQRCIPIP